MKDPVLAALKSNLARVQSDLDAIVAKAGASNRGLTTQENAEFDKLIAQRSDIVVRMEEKEAENKRHKKSMRSGAAILSSGMGQVHVTSEAMTYSPSSRHSYLLDLATIAVNSQGAGMGDGAAEARERMGQHLKELSVEARTNKKVARSLLESKFWNGGEIRTNPNTSSGTGGDFVPPLYLVQQYIPLARPGRVFANRCNIHPLPPGTDVINVPKITVGSLEAVQSANAAAVASQDIATSLVAAPVVTIAGQEDISMQLLEQSPIAMDGVVFDDLSRDYDRVLDTQILSGSGTNGQHTGVLSMTQAAPNTSVTATNAITVTSATFYDGSSTAGTQFRSVVKGTVAIETGRYEAPTAIWVHPRRSASWAYAGDSATAGSGRPLFIPQKYGSLNALGELVSVPVAQGVTGELFGLPVIKDANMPTNMNAAVVGGGTADPVVILKEDDLMLWEGQLRLRALPELLSGTLQIRYQIYNYSAFCSRFPPSISVLTGNTGLAAPGY